MGMFKAFFVVVAFVICGSVAHSAGIPVVDATNIVQNTIGAQEAVAQTLKQIEEYRKQLEQLQEQLRNGMGLGDLAGMFEDMLSGFARMQGGFAMSDPSSILGQFQSGGSGGGMSPTSGAVSSLGTYGGTHSPDASMAFQAQPGSGGTDMSQHVYNYGTPYLFWSMPQNQMRWYQKEGHEANIASQLEWMNKMGDHQKRIDEEMQEYLNKAAEDIKSAGDDSEGGTNKLLGQLCTLMTKLIEQNYITQQMTITREQAEANMYLAANARMMDADMQALKIREESDIYTQQQNGTTPLEWK